LRFGKHAEGARPSRLWLLRHGQGSLGSSDYDRLSELGRRQVARLAQRVAEELGSNPTLWSGALRRQRQTLQALSSSGVVFIDPCLNEYRVDRMIAHALSQAGKLGLAPPPARAWADPARFLDTFVQWFPEVLGCWQRGDLHDPCNGSWQAFRRRVLTPMDNWRSRLARGESVVVVTSAGVISTVTAALCGHELDWQRRLNVSLYNASVTELALDERDGWTLQRTNCVAHLKGKALQTLA